jgi:predicted homoserine dehydrogenase-like protein
MSLYRLLQQRSAAGRPVRGGLTGAGKFGSMFLNQLPTMPGVEIVRWADVAVQDTEAMRVRHDMERRFAAPPAAIAAQ